MKYEDLPVVWSKGPDGAEIEEAVIDAVAFELMMEGNDDEKRVHKNLQ